MFYIIEDLFRRYLSIDFIFSTKALHNLPREYGLILITEIMKTKEEIVIQSIRGNVMSYRLKNFPGHFRGRCRGGVVRVH